MNRRILPLAASISCWAVMVPASAQEFKQITNRLLVQVAAGRAEVWGLSYSPGAPYRYNAATKKFDQIGTGLPVGTLTQIAVGGGSLLQADAVWGRDQNQEVFQFDFTTNMWVLMAHYGSLEYLTVGDGYTDSCHPYEVWGLSENQQIFRFNYCTSVFDLIPGSLAQISTGGGDVWGINSSGQIFQYNFQAQQFLQIPGSLQQIAVGVNDVWGLDASGKAYRYEGAGFVLIDGAAFIQIATGENGVWGITTSIWNPSTTIIVRLDPNVETAVVVPGILTQIAVGDGAGVWGINGSDNVFSFVRP
ncbi:MAG: tectonin domain-containing protein [Bryobacteraceae bacterium]